MESKFSVLAKELAMSGKLLKLDPMSRHMALEDLKDFLSHNVLPLKEYKKIWKVLFYALWDSDKQKVQMELCEKMANLMLSFNVGKLFMQTLHYPG